MLKKISSLLMHLALFALACAIAAYWVIKIVTPAPTAAPPAAAAAALREADPTLAARMLGLVQVAPAALSNVQVVGLFSAGKQSSAVLSVDGKPARVYLLGQQVGPSARLVAVTPDTAVLDVGGTRQEARAPARPPVSFGGPLQPPGFARQGNELSAPSAGVPTPRSGVQAGFVPQPGFAPQMPPGQPPFVPQQMPQQEGQMPSPPPPGSPQTQ